MLDRVLIDFDGAALVVESLHQVNPALLRSLI